MLNIEVNNVKEIKKSIVITAMLCIAGLEVFALSKGINGVLLTGVIAVLAALGGVAVPEKYLKFK